jgi:hypothetical protein
VFDISNIVIQDITQDELRKWESNLADFIETGFAMGGVLIAEKSDAPLPRYIDVSHALSRQRIRLPPMTRFRSLPRSRARPRRLRSPAPVRVLVIPLLS